MITFDNSKRRRVLKELADFSFVKKIHQYQIGSEDNSVVRILPNLLTATHCQIFESVVSEDSECPMCISMHLHNKSREVFYQLRGQTKFSDNTILNPGEIKIIEAGVNHEVELMVGSACVVIAHPPIESLPKGNE